MTTILPPPRSANGVAFLRRVLAGEIYTGRSGHALARWAVGLDEQPTDVPHDRSDFARAMNVYWSAPPELQPAMRAMLTDWSEALRELAGGEIGWRYQVPDFETKRYYAPSWYGRDGISAYWQPVA